MDEATAVDGPGGDATAEDADQAAQVEEPTVADCDSCKWFMGLGYNCLLGRSRERCNNNPARRGDDELVERLLNMSDEDKAKLRTRLELEDDGLRERSHIDDGPPPSAPDVESIDGL